MASFMGGSAPAMASQILEGYILVGGTTIKGYTPSELTLLRVELEKLQRDMRAIVPAQDDAQANQARNRKIGRLNSALQVIKNALATKR
jgi:hypothetical protein